ncbi:AMP-dependent synthetase/ligase [Streptomyces sp. DSM 44917]|uniref:Acyl-CoA synthetase n=1 Tax=Streptomyces boetiae TaxID=3075541 RepID=A0ABU2L7G2_9ACTN|nr:AMP-dependent synthetase/ligase [Streptomyces sp. DSM 44917]MDT0307391.1 AMP-dependent synthetase/ligase [Streptomyces sp. DSM 44917]
MYARVLGDMRRAKKRGDLADRARPEVIREDGVVREVRVPALVEPPASGTPADIPFTNAAEDPAAVVLRRKTGGRWTPVTAAAFAREVTGVAKGLIASGLEPGGRVAVMARTCYEWAVLDFAIWAAGGQTVPVYATSSSEQVEWILHDSGARTIVVETAEHAANVPGGLDVRVWQIDEDALGQLTALGKDVPDAEVDARRTALTLETIATLVYTSGTTGRPKGCVLTHGNLHAECANLVELLKPTFEEVTGQTASTLLFLPLAHILGRTLQMACLSARIEIGHCPSIKPDDLRPELAAFRPTFLVGVPYLFEKIHDTGRATAERMGRGSSFERADRIAVRYGEAALAKYLGTGPGPGFGLSAARLLYDLLVYRRIRKALGGRMSYAISGGSPLDRRLNLFFYACGIVIYEGYGLTETTAAATLIPPLTPRPGTVGQPIPGMAVRIGEDGEVLIKGGTVFGSYWNNPAATKEVLDDEAWFATGDIGALDADGYLTITGRKKDIIITNGGKNVSPAVLEDRLRSRPPIGQCMVVGDGQAFIGALVTLDPEAMDHWLSVRKRPRDTPISELRHDKDLIADVQRAVDYANEAVSRAESIRKFTIIDGDFTEENGLLTPSLKVKRKAVAETYAKDIEELYGG